MSDVAEAVAKVLCPVTVEVPIVAELIVAEVITALVVVEFVTVRPVMFARVATREEKNPLVEVAFVAMKFAPF